MIDFKKEYLLHMLVVDDAVAKHLGIEDNRAYLRAFVLRDRETGELHALLRFHQLDGKSWTEVTHEDPEYLLAGLRATFTMATKMVAPEIEDPVKVFTPPRPDLSPDDTVAWLLDQDLIELSYLPGDEVLLNCDPDGGL